MCVTSVVLCWRLCCGSCSECDVEGNGLGATELIIHSASVGVAAGVPWSACPSTVPASPTAVQTLLSFAVVVGSEHRCNSSAGILAAVCLGQVSGTHSFSAAADFVGLVWKQGPAPDGQVRVGPLHLHNRRVYTAEVVMLRLRLGGCYKPGVQVQYLANRTGDLVLYHCSFILQYK